MNILKRIAALLAAGCVLMMNGLMLIVSANDPDFNGDFKLELVDFTVEGGSNWYAGVSGWGDFYELTAKPGETFIINYNVKPLTRELYFEKCTDTRDRQSIYAINPADDAETHLTFENTFSCRLWYMDKNYDIIDFRKESQIVSDYQKGQSGTCTIKMPTEEELKQIYETKGEYDLLKLEIGYELLYWDDISDYGYYYRKSEVDITLDFKEGSDTMDITVSTDALDSAGEDSGNDIEPEIVDGKKENNDKKDNSNGSDTGKKTAAGAVGAVVSAVTIGSAVSGGNKNKNNNGGKKRYKMYVWKDFGNTMQKGQTYKVCARMVEITEAGTELPRNDLTARIVPFSGNNSLIVTDGGMVNGVYKAAAVSVPENSSANEGIVSFRYTGEGGVFTKNVVFKLGEPKLVFEVLGEDGRTWYPLPLGQYPTLDMVAGGRGRDSVRFYFGDTAEDPVDIRFTNTSGFEVKHIKDTTAQYTYYAEVSNRTSPIEKLSGIFADIQTVYIGIKAKFRSGLEVGDSFEVNIYPEGISVLINPKEDRHARLNPRTQGYREILVNGKIEVLSYCAMKIDGSTSTEIEPTMFAPCFAFEKLDMRAAVTRDNECFTAGDFIPTTEETRNIVAKYQCPIKRFGERVLGFYPKDSIPELGEPYYIGMRLSVRYEGRSAQAEIPLRLLGVPMDRPLGWDKELEELCNTALRYFPDGWAQRTVSRFRQYTPEEFDKSELRMMRYDVIRTAQEYWMFESKSEMLRVKYYDTSDAIFKKPIRYVADIACNIVIKYYCKNHSAWIIPCKDLIIDTLDEALWGYIQTGDYRVDIVEKLLEQGVNAIENCIDMEKGVIFAADATGAAKKLGFALCAFMLAAMIKNYYKMDPKDFYDCLKKSFLDLSQAAVKQLVGVGLDKAMSSEPVRKFFDSKLMNEVNKYLSGSAKGTWSKPGAIGTRTFNQGGNVDLSTVREGAWKAVHKKTGREVFILVEVESIFGYRELLQEAVSSVLGEGISNIYDNCSPEKLSEMYLKCLGFTILDNEGNSVSVFVDAAKLFMSEDGLMSRAFDLIYNSLFGAFSFPSCTELAKDPAVETLKLEKN